MILFSVMFNMIFLDGIKRPKTLKGYHFPITLAFNKGDSLLFDKIIELLKFEANSLLYMNSIRSVKLES